MDRDDFCSHSVLMLKPALTLHDLAHPAGPPARGLTLEEAFARIMAFAGRERWAFPRTARVMHLVLMPCHTDDPVFESTLPIDGQARADIMAQFARMGLGNSAHPLTNIQTHWR